MAIALYFHLHHRRPRPQPLPDGAWACLGLTASVVTKTLSFSCAFSALTNKVIWLIVISFFFACGFVKTGLGDRIATYFVKWLGKSTLGLSYGLTIIEGRWCLLANNQVFVTISGE